MEIPNEYFRGLNAKEQTVFRQWARDNYKPGANINPVWHPIVREECEKMNREAGSEAPTEITPYVPKEKQESAYETDLKEAFIPNFYTREDLEFITNATITPGEFEEFKDWMKNNGNVPGAISIIVEGFFEEWREQKTEKYLFEDMGRSRKDTCEGGIQ